MAVLIEFTQVDALAGSDSVAPYVSPRAGFLLRTTVFNASCRK